VLPHFSVTKVKKKKKKDLHVIKDCFVINGSVRHPQTDWIRDLIYYMTLANKT